MDFVEFILRWIHFLAGITWIGVLYYFNFIQTPFFASDLGGGAKSAMTRGLVPNALWWFRWGAMFTFLSGWLIILMRIGHGGIDANAAWFWVILVGGTMGTLMWANVWFVIWPRQKLTIASAEAVAAGGEADPEAAKQAPFAARASRTNTLFSIPMLLFMDAAGGRWQLVDSAAPAYVPFYLAALVITLIYEAQIWIATPLQKPLGSVSGTIISGFVLSAILLGLGFYFL